jgi:hypothetical protein
MSKYRSLRAAEFLGYAAFAIVFLRAVLIYFSAPITHQEYIDSLDGLAVAFSSWTHGLFMLQIYGPAGETAIHMFLSSFWPAFICGLIFCGTDYVKHPERFKTTGIVKLAAMTIAMLGVALLLLYIFYDAAPGTARGSKMHLGLLSPVFAVTTPMVIAALCFGAILSAFHITLKILSLAR